MSLRPIFKKINLTDISNALGAENSAVYTVVAVAAFKGIFRPFFTMKDKKQDPKSRKYAAIREGATEIIAIPTYIGLAKLTAKLAPSLTLDKSIKGNFTSPNKALHFAGVCLAALIVIPGLCSLAMPYILKVFNKNDKNKVVSNEINPTAAMLPMAIALGQPVRPEKTKLFNMNTYGKVTMNTGGGVRI